MRLGTYVSGAAELSRLSEVTPTANEIGCGRSVSAPGRPHSKRDWLWTLSFRSRAVAQQTRLAVKPRSPLPGSRTANGIGCGASVPAPGRSHSKRDLLWTLSFRPAAVAQQTRLAVKPDFGDEAAPQGATPPNVTFPLSLLACRRVRVNSGHFFAIMRSPGDNR